MHKLFCKASCKCDTVVFLFCHGFAVIRPFCHTWHCTRIYISFISTVYCTSCSTFLMSSRKVALFPLNLTPCGPERLRLASTLSSFREERHLAKTASPKIQTEREGGGDKGDEE